MLRGLTAAYADVGDMFLFKGNATGLDASGLVLDLVLALGAAAPHCADEARLVLGDVKKFFPSRRVGRAALEATDDIIAFLF